MHSPVNDYLDFLRQPQLEATGLIAWLDQPGVGQVPVPSVPGLPLPLSGSARAKAPSLDQHRAEILAELGQLARSAGTHGGTVGHAGIPYEKKEGLAWVT